MMDNKYECITYLLAFGLVALTLFITIGPDIAGYLERKRLQREQEDKAIQEDREIERRVSGE